jgi:hypothetical protein
MALLMFIMPDMFAHKDEILRRLFTRKHNDASAIRIAKARTMMTPFILRRRKNQARTLDIHV